MKGVKLRIPELCSRLWRHRRPIRDTAGINFDGGATLPFHRRTGVDVADRRDFAARTARPRKLPRRKAEADSTCLHVPISSARRVSVHFPAKTFHSDISKLAFEGIQSSSDRNLILFFKTE